MWGPILTAKGGAVVLRHLSATKPAREGRGRALSAAVGGCREGVMAAAAEPSSSSSSERNPERSSSPLLTREVLCELFRSLHTLTGQVSGGAAGGGEHPGPLHLVLSEAGTAYPSGPVPAAGMPRPLAAAVTGRSRGPAAWGRERPAAHAVTEREYQGLEKTRVLAPNACGKSVHMKR